MRRWFKKKPMWGCLSYEKPHEWLPFTDREKDTSRSAIYPNWVQYRTCSVCKLTQQRVIA